MKSRVEELQARGKAAEERAEMASQDARHLQTAIAADAREIQRLRRVIRAAAEVSRLAPARFSPEWMELDYAISTLRKELESIGVDWKAP